MCFKPDLWILLPLKGRFLEMHTDHNKNLMMAYICRCAFTLDLSFPCSLVHSSGQGRTPWTSFGAGPCVLLGTGAPTNLSGRCCGTVEACYQFHCGNHCHGHPQHYHDHQMLLVETQAKYTNSNFQIIKRWHFLWGWRYEKKV